jgi:Flp pilus assembly pilin Flp
MVSEVFLTALRRFHANESGAVTVDYVVLTAAIVGLGIGAISSVRTGVAALGADINTSLGSATVIEIGCLGANITGACGSSGIGMAVGNEEISLPPDTGEGG